MDKDIAYNQALDYLYSFVDYSLKKASELAKANFNLDRMRDLMAALGNPEREYAVIHVAGTKGKGSTSALMASALTAAGYRTGLYTSPHLQDYCERIQADGRNMPHADLVEMVEVVRPHVAKIPALTTFEITTAIGLLYFARQGVQAAVVEVGLGGRLDATNIVNPCVSVITSLSYDHMAVLGDTLTLIAGEKAGIIKPGIPVVSSPQKDEALEVLERVSQERGSPLTLVGRDMVFSRLGQTLDGQDLTVTDRRSPGAKPVSLRIPLLGAHQVENAATAYTALLASGLTIHEKAIVRGFSNTNWQCRFEILHRDPPVILDSAHNQDSFEKLRRTLDETFPQKPIVLIAGASEDKSLAEMLGEIQPRLALLIATRADHPRALEPEKVAEVAQSLGIPVQIAAPVDKALQRGLEITARTGGILLSAGSMFVTAEVKTAWQKIQSGAAQSGRSKP